MDAIILFYLFLRIFDEYKVQKNSFWFEVEIFCNIVNYCINAFLLNKMITLKKYYWPLLKVKQIKTKHALRE